MADHRTHQAGTLSTLGRLLLPVMAGAAADHTDPHEVVPGLAAAALDQPTTASVARRSIHTFIYTILLLAIPPLGLLPIFPAFWVFDQIDNVIGLASIDRFRYMMSIPLMAWPTSFALVIVTVAFI